jgi:hypothetical protein
MTNKFGKYVFVVLLILGIGYNAFAQGGRMPMHNFRQGPNFNRPNNQFNRSDNQSFTQQRGLKRVQIIKENFISRQLALSPEQSEKFLPLYRQYQQESGNIRRLKRLNNSDAQANGTEQVNKDLYYERQLVDVRQRYTDEFLKIMPPEKVSLIFKSERAFNDEVIRQLNERNVPPPGN